MIRMLVFFILVGLLCLWLNRLYWRPNKKPTETPPTTNFIYYKVKDTEDMGDLTKYLPSVPSNHGNLAKEKHNKIKMEKLVKIIDKKRDTEDMGDLSKYVPSDE